MKVLTLIILTLIIMFSCRKSEDINKLNERNGFNIVGEWKTPIYDYSTKVPTKIDEAIITFDSNNIYNILKEAEPQTFFTYHVGNYEFSGDSILFIPANDTINDWGNTFREQYKIWWTFNYQSQDSINIVQNIQIRDRNTPNLNVINHLIYHRYFLRSH